LLPNRLLDLSESPLKSLINKLLSFLAMGGQHFGELAKLRGIVIHKISPYEQKAFAGAISNGVPNTFRRMSAQLFRVVPRKLNKK
jgi:hypothetical protein